MDMLSAEVFEGKYIYGTRDGFIIQGFYGVKDGLSSDGLDLGVDVTARFQSGFNDFGNPTMNKRVLRIKLYGISDGLPSVIIKFVEEYDIITRLDASSPPQVAVGAWDAAVWDNAIWAASQISLRRWIGTAGYGKKLALVLSMRSEGGTLLSDYEALFETGINL